MEAKSVKNDSTSLIRLDNVALNLSSRGFGAELGIKLNKMDRYSLKLNLAYLSFTKPQSIKMDKGSSLDVFPQVESVVIGCLMNYHPFKKRFLRVTGGLSYEIRQRYDVSFNTTTGLNLGGLQIASDDFGNIKFGIKWNAVRPYLGIGIGKPEMTKRVGVGFDVGIAYMGSPKLSLVYDGFLETTTIDEEMKKIERNMKGYSYYPYIALQLRYKINKVPKK